MPRAYIGIGSNLDEPLSQVQRSIKLIDSKDVRCLRRASLYGSSPMGPADQDDFVNTVLEVETALNPLELLGHCQRVEAMMGRVVTRHWGPRVIDLDVLMYGAARFEHPTLAIPHPGVTHRSFVLQPLAELIGDLMLPGSGQTISQLAKLCLEPRIWVLEGPILMKATPAV